MLHAPRSANVGRPLAGVAPLFVQAAARGTAVQNVIFDADVGPAATVLAGFSNSASSGRSIVDVIGLGASWAPLARIEGATGTRPMIDIWIATNVNAAANDREVDIQTTGTPNNPSLWLVEYTTCTVRGSVDSVVVDASTDAFTDSSPGRTEGAETSTLCIYRTSNTYSGVDAGAGWNLVVPGHLGWRAQDQMKQADALALSNDTGRITHDPIDRRTAAMVVFEGV